MKQLYRKNYRMTMDSRAGIRLPTAARAASSAQEIQQKKRFLLFIKILFKALDQTGDPEVKEKAKAIVADCTRRNRLGDPNYVPLMDAVDRRLRGHVGEVVWRRAHMYMQHFMKRETRPRILNRTPAASLSPRRNQD